MIAYLDSDVIIAINDKSDTLHSKAVNIADKITGQVKHTVVGVNVLIECLAIISQRLGIVRSLRVLDRALQNYKIAYLDEPTVALANHFFFSRSSKNVSYSDCLSFAIMKLFNITTVFTFDKHFQKQGFKILK